MDTERRFVWVRGKLKEVRDEWIWLFRLLRIGFDLPEDSQALREVMQALREVMQAMETYHRACQVYLKV